MNTPGEKRLDLGQITREQIEDYAACSGDDNRIHLDDNFAKEAGLPSIIAHGMLTMGLAGVALERWGYELSKMRHFESKFKDKVFVNEQLFAVLHRQSKNENQETTVEFSVIKSDDSEVLRAQAKLADIS